MSDIVRIDEKSSLSIENEILTVYNDFSQYSKQCLYFIFFFTFLILFSSVLIGILINDLFSGLIFSLIFLLALNIPCLIFYLNTKNHIIKLKIDKAQDIIIYQNSCSIYRKIRQQKFSEVNYLIFNQKSSGPTPGGSLYSLKFFLKQDLKKIEIFFGRKEHCRDLGKIIAEFINKPLYYKEGTWREKII